MALDWQVFCQDTIDRTVVQGCFGTGGPKGTQTYLDWLLQAWGRDPAIRLDVLFMGLRRMAPERIPVVALGYPYLAAWLVGASAANQRDEAMAAGFVLLGAWALIGARRERVRRRAQSVSRTERSGGDPIHV